jgi:hypothetical protein
MVYFTTLYVAQTQMAGQLMNHKLENIWEDAIMA